jgi:hypothetical protein
VAKIQLPKKPKKSIKPKEVELSESELELGAVTKMMMTSSMGRGDDQDHDQLSCVPCARIL